jgi:hypothetical protein
MLIVSDVVKEFPALYCSQNFITVFRSARHFRILYQSARYFFKIGFKINLTYSAFFPSSVPGQMPYALLVSQMSATCPAYHFAFP